MSERCPPVAQLELLLDDRLEAGEDQESSGQQSEQTAPGANGRHSAMTRRHEKPQRS